MTSPATGSEPPASRPKTHVENIDPLLPSRVYLLSPGDVHLAGRNRGKALIEILSATECAVLVLNGDFLDVDSLKRLLKRLSASDRALIKLIEEKRHAGTRVVYTQGNHDEEVTELLRQVEILRQIAPFEKGTREYEVLEALALIGNWERTEVFVHEREGVTYVHAHGDQWDPIVRGRYFGRAIARVGAILWEILKRTDSEKHKIAIFIKRRVKLWTKVSGKVADGAVALAREHGARYAFAGHTHDLRVAEAGGVGYINAGSFDLYEAGLASIGLDGRATLHRVRARSRPIDRAA
jgi:predicted phosphodiesterase